MSFFNKSRNKIFKTKSTGNHLSSRYNNHWSLGKFPKSFHNKKSKQKVLTNISAENFSCQAFQVIIFLSLQVVVHKQNDSTRLPPQFSILFLFSFHKFFIASLFHRRWVCEWKTCVRGRRYFPVLFIAAKCLVCVECNLIYALAALLTNVMKILRFLCCRLELLADLLAFISMGNHFSH